jgi:hypothetical protein
VTPNVLVHPTAPPHVRQLFQLPVRVEVNVAAYAGVTGSADSASMTISMAAMNLTIDFWKDCRSMLPIPIIYSMIKIALIHQFLMITCIFFMSR